MLSVKPAASYIGHLLTVTHCPITTALPVHTLHQLRDRPEPGSSFCYVGHNRLNQERRVLINLQVEPLVPPPTRAKYQSVVSCLPRDVISMETVGGVGPVKVLGRTDGRLGG